jgi:hypothetical protein
MLQQLRPVMKDKQSFSFPRMSFVKEIFFFTKFGTLSNLFQTDLNNLTDDCEDNPSTATCLDIEIYLLLVYLLIYGDFTC